MKLSRLKTKLEARQGSLKRHTKNFRALRRSQVIRRAWQRGKIEADRQAIKKLEGLIKTERQRGPISGTGPWGGCESILEREVVPAVARNRGPGYEGSGKRSETYGNPESDHHISQKDASARDFLLVADHSMARLIYGGLTGNSPSAWPGDYADFYFKRAGRDFRGQIIASNHGTGPHLHVGIRRA